MKRYTPGVCNIGMKNRLGRLAYGVFFFCVGVWFWAFIMINHLLSYTKIFLFVPFYLAYLGIYQALFGFCIHHALKRTYDMR